MQASTETSKGRAPNNGTANSPANSATNSDGVGDGAMFSMSPSSLLNKSAILKKVIASSYRPFLDWLK